MDIWPGQLLPTSFRNVGRLELGRMNPPAAIPIWPMIVPMLLNVDFGAQHEVGCHAFATARLRASSLLSRYALAYGPTRHAYPELVRDRPLNPETPGD